MANTKVNRTLLGGGAASPKVVKSLHLISDGTQESGYVLFQNNSFWDDPNCGSIIDIQASGSSCICRLSWDATSAVPAISLNPASDFHLNFEKFGGLTNARGTGATGNLLLTTSGLASGSELTLIITLRR